MLPSMSMKIGVWSFVIVLGLASWFLLRSEAEVGDRQFIQAMIPHHSAAIQMVRESSISDPRLKKINTFLFALFIARFVFFCGIFGGLHADLAHFVGIVGLNIALNGGIRRAVSVPAPESFQPVPA